MTVSRRDALRSSGAAIVGMSVRRLGLAFESERTMAPPEARRVSAQGEGHDTLSRRLARFVVTTRFRDLPAPVVEAWKTIVLDSLAVGFVGSTDRLARSMNQVARTLSGTAECTVMNSTYRTDAGGAAWLNGTLIGTPQSDSPETASQRPRLRDRVSETPSQRRRLRDRRPGLGDGWLSGPGPTVTSRKKRP